ncbi:poly-gamma-glutamate hydrolase family protein [Alteribacillus sp. JSM 102045]|uniref:poly-gamma-glutamate hydrolase family protein n=1 Tax=Alteribacillus sp. JSM 102045 TaxID=1562101 RepID=UPI0035C04B87
MNNTVIGISVFFISVSLFFFVFTFWTHANTNYYNSYEELAENEVLNEDYEINYEQRNSDISILAIHGGGIEPGTSEVAKGLAHQINDSYYLFEGIKPTNNLILHINSKNFDEPIGREIAQNSVSALSIHGYHGDETIIYVGGRNREYKEMIRSSLQKRGFQVEDAPDEIAGTSKNNIVNDNQLKKGAQLELTAGLRKSFFENHDWSRKNRENTTDIYDQFIDGLKEATEAYDVMLKQSNR